MFRRPRVGWLLSAVVALTLGTSVSLSAQSTKMPSTLRYGSGILDVPVSSVLPHLAFTGTYSGFWGNVDQAPVLDPATGQIMGFTPADFNGWYSDGSVALGLYDRVEVGATFQEFGSDSGTGDVYGFFGRVNIFQPVEQGIGLAAGTRYVKAAEFENGSGSANTGRLGFADPLLTGYPGTREVDTEWSVYGVATAFLRGFDSTWFPEHDVTFTAGWGNGMFEDGGDLDYYSTSDSDGWFVGSAVHLSITENALLNLMGEYNGFDVNFGAQLDWDGYRIGAHVLGANNNNDDITIYRSLKFGILGSIAICPQNDGFTCTPELIERRPTPRDTVRLPAPAPDTVVVTREVAPPLPTGTPASLCLATGQDVQVLVTAQGDTLVGPDRTSIADLRPGVVFAGSYAAGHDWFEQDEDITFEEGTYSKVGGEVRMDCADIMRVGEHMGVPLFAERDAERPFTELLVPVRAGVWQRYQAGVRQTRGEG